MDAAPEQAPAQAKVAATGDEARQLRAALPQVLSLAPRIVAAWCEGAGVAPDGPLAGAAWLAGPVALLANLRRLAELLESQPRPLFTARDLRRRMAGRVVTELRAQSFAERRLYRDAPVSLVLKGATAVEVLAAPASVPELTVEVRDPVTAETLASLAGAGALHVREASTSQASGVVLVLPALYAKDELGFAARRIAAEIAASRAFKLPGPSTVLVATYWPQRERFVEVLTGALSSLDGVSIEGLGPEEAEGFLAEAVPRANALGASAVEIVAHVVQEEDPRIAEALDQAIVTLGASSIGLNEWPAMASLRGAGPLLGHPLVEKTLVRGPAVARRAPLYFLDARQVGLRGERLAAFQAAPSIVSRLRAAP